MYRFLIPLLVALFFLPLTLHAQKEDFQPPKVHQNTTRVKKSSARRKTDVKNTTKKAETKAAPIKATPKPAAEKPTVKKTDRPTVKKTDKPTVSKPVKKVEKQQSAAPKDTTPTPGFIRYIPKTRDLNP